MYTTLNDLSFDDKYVYLAGIYNADGLLPSNIQFVHRKKGITRSFPINTCDSNQWNTTIDIDSLLIDHGKWDVYLVGDEITPIRMTADKQMIIQPIPLLYDDKMSKRLAFYLTKYGNLSFRLTDLYIQPDYYSVDINTKGDIIFKGSLSEQMIDLMSAENILVLLEPKSNAAFQFKTMAKTIKLDNQVQLEFTLTNSSLHSIANINEDKWNVQLLFKIDDRSFSVKLYLKDKQIKESSTLLLKKEKLTQLYLYSSINNFISLGVNKVKLISGINSCEFTKTSLLISGFAYLEGTRFKQNKLISRHLIIKERGSEKKLIDHQIDSTKDLFENDNNYYYKIENSKFVVNIPLSKVLNSLVVGHHVLDVWIQINFDSYKFTQKIGFRKFNYSRDYFNQSHKVFLKNKVSHTYLATTPFGNLKLLNYSHKTLHYLFLKYEKLIRKLNGKDIWLIGERQDTAQDNGYHFFKFCREKHPKKRVYYVIDRNSNDYERVSKLGNVVIHGSTKHYLLATQASTFIGTHDLEYILPTPGFELTAYRNGARVFLQHGVLGRKHVEYDKKYYQYPFNLFLVSSDSEKEIVKNIYEYADQDIKVTGLPRFDSLLKKEQQNNSILLIPTWREWISTNEQFTKSDYYKNYFSFLTNPKLHQLLEEYNITIEFYPHYRMQKFIHHFNTIKTDRINIIQQNEVTIHHLIKRNKLMITDYSSVSFDFNYLSKPVVFYHFDFNRFFKNGILRPVKETFIGEIATNERQLIHLIENYIKSDFRESRVFTNRKNMIFKKIDANNNERIYNEIIKMKQNKQV